MNYSCHVDTVYEAQAVVLGGGPAGIGAAISAARSGLRVALVEKYGFCGGMATAGLVAPFMKVHTIDGKYQIIKGIFDEMIRRMEKQGGAIHPSRITMGTPLVGFLGAGHNFDTPFDPEVMKRVVDEMLEESGVRVFYHAQFLDVIKEDNRITHVLIADKSGIRAIAGEQFIDCTGDGDVAVRCGEDYVTGDGNGTLQPATTMFQVSNVITEETRRYVEEHPEDFMFLKPAEAARAAGDFNINRRRAIIQETVHPGIWSVNSTRVQDYDATDADQRSKAEAEGRRQVQIAYEYLKKYVPGFSNAVLIKSGAEIGTRETRHIVGEYCVTEEDILAGKHFPDCIAMSGFPMDVHDNSGRKDLFIEPEGINYYEIPYRCMVPKKTVNLLVAGRCVSATHQAAAAIRVMPTCFAMGEAAGIAASLAIQDHTFPTKIDYEQLRHLLQEKGACVTPYFESDTVEDHESQYNPEITWKQRTHEKQELPEKEKSGKTFLY